jgi:hypothetical protein
MHRLILRAYLLCLESLLDLASWLVEQCWVQYIRAERPADVNRWDMRLDAATLLRSNLEDEYSRVQDILYPLPSELVHL